MRPSFESPDPQPTTGPEGARPGSCQRGGGSRTKRTQVLVTVEALGPMRAFLRSADGKATLELAEGGTVQDALRAIGVPGKAQWNASIDGSLVYADHVLREGDHLLVFAPIAGGLD